jgi:hypothetical protein
VTPDSQFSKGAGVRPLWALALVPLLVSFAAKPAAAQEQALDDSDRQLLEDLAAPAHATREAATRKLLQRDTLEVDQLRAWLEAATELEQRHRLLNVAGHHAYRRMRAGRFDRPQRGAIGVQHRPALGPRPGADPRAVVAIYNTLPGFPGYAHLEPGDMIVALNGEAFARRNGEQFAQQVTAFEKGQTISVTVIRDGQRQTIEFELAGAQALGAMYGGTEGDQQRPAYRRQWLGQRAELLDGLDQPPILGKD